MMRPGTTLSSGSGGSGGSGGSAPSKAGPEFLADSCSIVYSESAV